MSKLVRTAIGCTFKNIGFLIAAGVSLLLGIFAGHRTLSAGGSSDYIYFDDIYIVILMFAVAAFAVLTFCREFSDGTVRNKLVTVCTKPQFYLSQLITVCLAGAALILIFTLTCGIMIHSKLDSFSAAMLLRVLLFNLTGSAAVSALTVLICIIFKNPVFSLIAVSAALIGLYTAEMELGNALREPKQDTLSTTTFYEDGTEGATVFIKEPNPYYIGGAKRKVYQLAFDSNPFCRLETAIDIIINDLFSGKEVSEAFVKKETAGDLLLTSQLDRLDIYPLFDLGVIVLISAAGIVVFRKRNVN